MSNYENIELEFVLVFRGWMNPNEIIWMLISFLSYSCVASSATHRYSWDVMSARWYQRTLNWHVSYLPRSLFPHWYSIHPVSGYVGSVQDISAERFW